MLKQLINAWYCSGVIDNDIVIEISEQEDKLMMVIPVWHADMFATKAIFSSAEKYEEQIVYPHEAERISLELGIPEPINTEVEFYFGVEWSQVA